MKKLLLAFFAMFFLIGCGDDVEATSKDTNEDSVREKTELEATAVWNADRFRHTLNEIRSYYMAGLRLEFGTLESMTSNHNNFEDSALKEKIKVGKPIKFLVGKEKCAEMTVKQKGNEYFFITEDINKKKEICKVFHNLDWYKDKKIFLIGYVK
ncbi:MAG: hypothetical protein IJ923_00640 [Campylobacter sp.]|nr:hypothetical protein [Campylobacter sp.]